MSQNKSNVSSATTPEKSLDPNSDMRHIKVEDWMQSIGPIYGSIEVRENVNDLESHCKPAIESLNLIRSVVSENLSTEIDKLLCYYETMAKICQQMKEKMEMPDESMNCASLAISESVLFPE